MAESVQLLRDLQSRIVCYGWEKLRGRLKKSLKIFREKLWADIETPPTDIGAESRELLSGFRLGKDGQRLESINLMVDTMDIFLAQERPKDKFGEKLCATVSEVLTHLHSEIYTLLVEWDAEKESAPKSRKCLFGRITRYLELKDGE